MTDAPDDTNPAADDAALGDLDRSAARTEQEAVDAGILSDPDDQKFHESGTIRPDLDDQAIAPPG